MRNPPPSSPAWFREAAVRLRKYNTKNNTELKLAMMENAFLVSSWRGLCIASLGRHVRTTASLWRTRGRRLAEPDTPRRFLEKGVSASTGSR